MFKKKIRTALPRIPLQQTTGTSFGTEQLTHTVNGSSEAGMNPVRKTWVENLAIVLHYKWYIITISLLVATLTGLYAFLAMPNWYTATAVILPARRSGGLLDNISSGISSSLKEIGLPRVSSSGSDAGYTPLSLLSSRELREKIIRQFHLDKEYGVKSVADALGELNEHIQGDQSEEGNFSINFEDKDPKRAADVANAFVAGLNEINSRMMVEESQHNITYVEQRYNTNAHDLDSAETALGEFQKKYGLFALPEQAKTEMTAIADLEQQKYKTEIQLRNYEQFYGSGANETVMLKNTLDELTNKLAQMRTGMDLKANSFVSTNVLPDVALQFLRLTREVEIQSKLKAFLLPTFEQAKLDLNKETLAFMTLDHAEVPTNKSKPKRSTLVMLSLFASVALSSIGVIVLANVSRLRSQFDRDRALLGVS